MGAINFNGWGLLLVVAALGFAMALWQNRIYRRALRDVAANCKRCTPGMHGRVYNGGTMHMCPNCGPARRALGER